MWKEAALLLLGALVGGLLNALIDRVKARTAAEYWEAQERWKFKANIYSRALSAMRRMRTHKGERWFQSNFPRRGTFKSNRGRWQSCHLHKRGT
jgi:hypothetical protein